MDFFVFSQIFPNPLIYFRILCKLLWFFRILFYFPKSLGFPHFLDWFFRILSHLLRFWILSDSRPSTMFWTISYFFEFFSFPSNFLKIFLDFFGFFDILSNFLFGFVKFYRSLQGSFFPVCIKLSRILPNYLGFSRGFSHFLRFFPNSLIFLRILLDSLLLSRILPNFFGILGFLRIL